MGDDHEKHAGEGGERYGQSGAGGGRQDQGERKDDGWVSRQGGSQDRAKDVDGYHPGGHNRNRDHQDASGMDRGVDIEHLKSASQGVRPDEAGSGSQPG